jgi:hypothetical protein
MNSHSNVVLIFAKAPIAGHVKTRLIPVLGENGAAELYRELMQQLIKKLRGEKPVDIELWCTPDRSHVEFQHIQSVLGCPLFNQVGIDLGERMSYAVDKAFRHYSHVILIGIDCPEMSLDLLRQVVFYLENGKDAVLVPAEDGGYVLLGLSKTDPCLFHGIPWGTDKVTEITRNCFHDLGWDWHELPVLWDLDRPEDLERFRASHSTHIA